VRLGSNYYVFVLNILFVLMAASKAKLHKAESYCQDIIEQRLDICRKAREYQLQYQEDSVTIHHLNLQCDTIATQEKCCIAKHLCPKESEFVCTRECQDLLFGIKKDPAKRKECVNASFALSRCLNKYFRYVADRSGNYSEFKDNNAESFNQTNDIS